MYVCTLYCSAAAPAELDAYLMHIYIRYETKDLFKSWAAEAVSTVECSRWVEATALIVTRVEYANWYIHAQHRHTQRRNRIMHDRYLPA